MSSKRPKLAYHQRPTANNNNEREETSAADVVAFEYTGRGKYAGTGDRVPDNVTHARIHPSVIGIRQNAFHSREHLKEVVLNEGLINIGLGAFMNCSSLQSIKLPSTVKEIDNDSFCSCKSLVEVVLNDRLREIGSNAFNNCTTLKSITLPSSINVVDTGAFSICRSLSEVVLSDGLKKIGNGVFRSCTSLQSITIPSTVDEIGPNAFYYCNSLTEVVLNEGLKKIGRAAFNNCTEIRSMTITSKVTCIEQHAFRGCSSLREVVIHNAETQIDNKSFYNCTSLERFKFPSLWTRLDNIIQAGQRDIEAKMDDIPAVEWRDGELSIPPVVREIENPLLVEGVETVVKVDKEKLGKIVRLVRCYEIKEATTLFELALWKWKSKIESSPSNRKACRIEVPGPVKDAILQYL